MTLSTSTALLIELLHGEGYGLDLMDRIDARSKGCVKVTFGTLYPVLRQLERKGLLVARETDASRERGSRPRRYYGLTAAGRQAAEAQRAGLLALFAPPGGHTP